MKRVLLLYLLIHSGLVAFGGLPCLPYDKNRTKDQLIQSVESDATLLAAYNVNINNMYQNLGETPQSFRYVVNFSALVTKAELNAIGIYTINNGWRKTLKGEIFYIKDEFLKEGYTYLYYKGFVIGAVNCGNPNAIYLKPPVEKPKEEPAVHKVDTPKITINNYITNTNNCNCNNSENQQQANSAYDEYVEGRREAPVVQTQTGVQVRHYAQANVSVRRYDQRPQRVVYQTVYANQRPSGPVTPNHPNTPSGPVTPNHGDYDNPVTPNHKNRDGPVPPRHW